MDKEHREKRDIEVYRMRESGKALEEIGNMFLLTNERIRQIHANQKRKWQPKCFLDKLPKRAAGALVKNRPKGLTPGPAGDLSDPKVLASLEFPWHLFRLRDFGRGSFTAVADQLESDGYINSAHEWVNRGKTLCPHCGKPI